MKKKRLNVKAAAIVDAEDKLTLPLTLDNPLDRTIHVYGSPRGMRYDAATKTLTVLLTEQGLEEPPLGTTFNRPRFVSVDAGGSREIRLTLPRVLSHLGVNSQIPGEPAIEVEPIHEAETVQVEVGWSDQPFYFDPRDKKKSTGQQLREWEGEVARCECKRAYGGSKPEPKAKPKPDSKAKRTPSKRKPRKKG